MAADSGSLDDIDARCESINRHFIRTLFTRVSRSLYQRHKETFAFLTTCKLLLVSAGVRGFVLCAGCGPRGGFVNH